MEKVEEIVRYCGDKENKERTWQNFDKTDREKNRPTATIDSTCSWRWSSGGQAIGARRHRLRLRHIQFPRQRLIGWRVRRDRATFLHPKTDLWCPPVTHRQKKTLEETFLLQWIASSMLSVLGAMSMCVVQRWHECQCLDATGSAGGDRLGREVAESVLQPPITWSMGGSSFVSSRPSWDKFATQRYSFGIGSESWGV